MIKPTHKNPKHVKNHAALADALGITRQALSYHTRKAGSPKPRLDGRHSVAEWETHLRGRTMLLVAQHEADPQETGPRWIDGVESGITTLAKLIADVLPAMVGSLDRVCEMKLSKAQLERLAWAITRVTNSAADDILASWHLPLIGEDDGE